MKKLIICLMTAVMLLSHSVLFAGNSNPKQNYAADRGASTTDADVDPSGR